jgi:arsenate reductase
MPCVLFLCVHNAGRSQIAAGWLRSLAGTDVTVLSAGSTPADAINPVAAQAMAEVGIDIAAHSPQRWTNTMASEADIVVSMGCGDSCPTDPGTRRVEWDIPDPAGRPIDEVRPIRDRIRTEVQDLLRELARPAKRPT